MKVNATSAPRRRGERGEKIFFEKKPPRPPRLRGALLLLRRASRARESKARTDGDVEEQPWRVQDLATSRAEKRTFALPDCATRRASSGRIECSAVAGTAARRRPLSSRPSEAWATSVSALSSSSTAGSGALPTSTIRLRARPGPISCASSRRSEEHTSELQSRGHLVCRLL